LFHFSTTIEGGVSEGNYATFNLGMFSGDDIEKISENRKRLISEIGIEEEKLIIPYQIHSDNILSIDTAFLSKSDLEQTALLNGVDAVITDQKDVCIGISTADCVPILLYDHVLNVFAAVHAGWRGTVAKLVEKTIFEMNMKYGCNSANLIACIGPAISMEYFEVGEEVIYDFMKAGFIIDSIAFRHPDTGKTYIDLWFANELLLSQAGILNKHLETTNLCTYSNADLFFSARRQGIKSGRMISGGFLI